jgi:hypothetical protein
MGRLPAERIQFAHVSAHGASLQIAKSLDLLVGAGRFELPTPCSRSKCASSEAMEPHRSANVPPSWLSLVKTRLRRFLILPQCRCHRVPLNRPNLTCRPSKSRLSDRRGPWSRRYRAVRSPTCRRCPILGGSHLLRSPLPGKLVSKGPRCIQYRIMTSTRGRRGRAARSCRAYGYLGQTL